MISMDELNNALLVECRSIAGCTLHNYDKAELITEIWTSEEREDLSNRYLEHAKEGLQLIGNEADPLLVLRAVRYLGGHAMPPMKDSTAWFREGLMTLLTLARPYAGTPPGGEPFFEDLRKGMAQAEAWGKESSQGE